MYCDNQAAIYIAENPVYHECTKRFEVDCYLVHQNVAAYRLYMCHLAHQLANILGIIENEH